MAQQTDKSDSYRFLQIRCEEDFKDNLRMRAAEDGKSMSAFVRDTLQQTWEGTDSELSESMQNSGESTQSGDFEADDTSQDVDSKENPEP